MRLVLLSNCAAHWFVLLVCGASIARTSRTSCTTSLLLCCHQDHLLPEEYVITMRNNLLDKCPVSGYDEVVRIIKEDLGSTPEALFKSFQPTPIASASLAQVRRGV